MKAVFAAIASLVIVLPTAHAADSHKHEDVNPKYGGLVKEANHLHYELIAKPDRLTLYVEDHGKKVDAKGIAAQVTLRDGAERTDVALQPAGENKLEAVGSFKVQRGTVVIVQVKRSGKPDQAVRFTLP